MVKKKAAPEKKKTGWMAIRPRMDFRFENKLHRELVHKAAKLGKRSMNDWMVQVTLQAAKAELEAHRSKSA